MPGSERAAIGLSDMVPPAATGPVSRSYTLWPYDRPETKGQLKGVTVRVEDGKVLVLGYRCAGSHGPCAACQTGIVHVLTRDESCRH